MSLPSGEVAFCFADVEGSTKLFASLGNAFVDMVGELRAIVHELLGEHDGHLVSTEGDGFFLVFADPVRGIECCLALQEKVAESDWLGRELVRVRAGLHLGNAEPVDNDYIAFEVHEAARIAAAGHGGQTLVSDEVAARVGGSLPADVVLTDLGVHALRDIKPRRLFQVNIGAHEPFPALRAQRPEHGSLPVLGATLVGRDEVLEQVEDRLQDGRLVTIVGSGGVGKTSVALAVAHRVRSTRRDGVWFVDLAAVSDGSRLAGRVLETLGVRPDSAQSESTQLVASLSAGDALLVFDNCEHVIDEASQLTADILRACSNVRVLATSQEPLRVDGERTLRLDPLTKVDSVTLFFERANTLVTTPENSSAVVRIVERLDGIPLAIELAAARTNVLTPKQIAERLDDRFALLTGGARSADERQQTLEAALDWSYGLLDDDEQALLRRLSVIVGTFDLTVAEAIGGPNTFELLTRLIDKSMVAASVGSEVARFRLLETVRLYGLRRLTEADEIVAARDAHLAWFESRAVLALGLLDERETETFAALLLDDANVTSALEWAVASKQDERAAAIAAHMWLFWAFVGRAREGLGRIEPLLATVDRSSEIAMQLHTGAAWLSNLAVEPPAATERLARPALEHARARPTDEAARWYDGWAATCIGIAEVAVAGERAMDIELEAIDLARRASALYVESQAWLHRAQTLQFEEGMAGGDEAYVHAANVARMANSPAALAAALTVRGGTLHEMGELEQAREVLLEAVPHARRSTNVGGLIESLRVFGRLKLYAGDDDAHIPLLEARDLARRSGQPSEEGYAEWFLAWHAFELGDSEGVHEHCDKAFQLFLPFMGPRPMILLAGVLLRQLDAQETMLDGEPHKAREVFDEHRVLGEAAPVRWMNALTMNALGLWHWHVDDLDAAEQEFRHAYETAWLDHYRHRESQARACAIRGLSLVALERGEAYRAALLSGAVAHIYEPGFFDSRLGFHAHRDALTRQRLELGAEDFARARAEGAVHGLDVVSYLDG